MCLKSYRLTPQDIQLYKEGDLTPETLRNLNVGYERLFVEISIVMKNYDELNEMLHEELEHISLDLGTASMLENQMRCLIERVDELYQETIRYNKYQQVVFKQETEKHRALVAENAMCLRKGESPVPEEKVLKQFRPLPMPDLMPQLHRVRSTTIHNTFANFARKIIGQLELM